MNFTFNIQNFSESFVISLRGKIMSDSEINEISLSISKLISENKSKLIFNLSDLTYLNSSGINFFMKTLTKTRINNGDLIFYGVNGNVKNLFQIAKLNEIYTIYNSEKEALNHFKNKE